VGTTLCAIEVKSMVAAGGNATLPVKLTLPLNTADDALTIPLVIKFAALMFPDAVIVFDVVLQKDAAPFSVDKLDVTAKVMQEIN
jgi:hypothetical protein